MPRLEEGGPCEQTEEHYMSGPKLLTKWRCKRYKGNGDVPLDGVAF